MHHITSLSKLDYGPAAARPPGRPACQPFSSLCRRSPPLDSTRLSLSAALHCAALHWPTAAAHSARPPPAAAPTIFLRTLQYTTLHYMRILSSTHLTGQRRHMHSNVQHCTAVVSYVSARIPHSLPPKFPAFSFVGQSNAERTAQRVPSRAAANPYRTRVEVE